MRSTPTVIPDLATSLRIGATSEELQNCGRPVYSAIELGRPVRPSPLLSGKRAPQVQFDYGKASQLRTSALRFANWGTGPLPGRWASTPMLAATTYWECSREPFAQVQESHVGEDRFPLLPFLKTHACSKQGFATVGCGHGSALLFLECLRQLLPLREQRF